MDRTRGAEAGPPGKLRSRVARVSRALDAVWEVVDARAPLASRAPGLARLAPGRPRVLLLAKSDLAEEGETARWILGFEAEGRPALAVSRTEPAEALASRLLAATRAAGAAARGGSLAVLVFGLPNVGKSTLVNRLAARAAARTGARPGVTRGETWVRAEGFELVDTPGLLPARLSRRRAVLLRALELVGDDAAPAEEAAAYLLSEFAGRRPEALIGRYGFDPRGLGAEELLARVARSQGALGRGGRGDLARAAQAVLRDVRLGRLGRLTLERRP